MAAIILIPVNEIISRNYSFTGIPCDAARVKAVEGCYGSFFYYATVEEQVASIVASIAKGHFFVDGNKRTALYVYLLLCAINKLEFIMDVDEQVKVIVKIASAQFAVDTCRDILFPDKSGSIHSSSSGTSSRHSSCPTVMPCLE